MPNANLDLELVPDGTDPWGTQMRANLNTIDAGVGEKADQTAVTTTLVAKANKVEAVNSVASSGAGQTVTADGINRITLLRTAPSLCQHQQKAGLSLLLSIKRLRAVAL